MDADEKQVDDDDDDDDTLNYFQVGDGAGL